MKTKVYKLFLISTATLLAFLSFLLILPKISASESVYDSVLRLHIIANSDSEADQKVKLIVRDALLEYEKAIIKDAKNKDEARKILMSQGDEILALIENVLLENGFDYKAQLYMGNFYFPNRTYGEEFYPAGNYDALRIVLGNGAGKNWWCVMFPPLCILEVDDGKTSHEEVRFSSLLLNLLKRIDGGDLWNLIEEKYTSLLQ